VAPKNGVIAVLEDKDLHAPPGSGIFIKFPFIRSQLRKIEPELADSDSDDEDVTK